VRETFRGYQAAVRAQFDQLTTEGASVAADLDERQVDPAFDRFSQALDAARVHYHASARRGTRNAQVGTVILVVLGGGRLRHRLLDPDLGEAPPVECMKIDRSFVDGLGHDAQDTAIVDGVIAFAKTLGLQVTAEGIETAEQLEQLRALGCDFGQGFYFARSLPAGDLEAFLDAHQAKLDAQPWPDSERADA
jgi:hypothetical protein